jgi:hypothetical protein
MAPAALASVAVFATPPAGRDVITEIIWPPLELGWRIFAD